MWGKLATQVESQLQQCIRGCYTRDQSYTLAAFCDIMYDYWNTHDVAQTCTCMNPSKQLAAQCTHPAIEDEVLMY